MKIQVSYEIDIPDGYELASKEPVFPKRGEQYITSDGQILTAGSDFKTCRYFIVRERWHWPSFIKARWLKRSHNSLMCYIANDKNDEDALVKWSVIHPSYVDFTPPDDYDVHENPNWVVNMP